MANDMDAAAGASGAVRGQIVRKPSGILKAPKNIIQTPISARMLYYKCRAQHFPRIELYSMIEGLIAGNPPYNPSDLQTHGLSHIANFNNGDGRAFYERAALAYWNLLNASQYICKFTLKGVQHEDKAKWEEILASKWDETVRSWEDFERQINTLSAQIVKFGISPACWTDEQDWRWKTIELSRFFLPDQASTDLSLLTYCFIESNFTAQYLWDVYENLPDKKDATPWNKEALGRFLLYRANSFLKQDPGTPPLTLMDIQQRIQNRDLLYDSIFSDNITLITMLYEEYDKKVTHAIFDRTYESDFLYKADSLYTRLSDALVIFTASPGEFTIHSNRGVGHKIFSPCQATMQIDCDMVNMVRLGSTPFIRTLNTGSQDFSPIRVIPGMVTNIGNAEFVQNNLAANIQPVVGVGQYILQKLNINSANSGDDPGTSDRDTGSVAPSVAKIRATKEFGLLKHNVAHFYNKLDKVFQNMLVKMLASKSEFPANDKVKEWKESCIAEGIPQQFFDTKSDGTPKILGIKATRVAGDGSQLASIMGLEAFAPLVPSLPSKGLEEYKRRAVIAYFGKEDVPAFLPQGSTPDEDTGGASLAAVENAIMRNGESPVWSPDNDQRGHMATHIALGTDTIQRLQQQMITPVDADKIFVHLVPHGDQHFQALARNPLESQFVMQVKQPWEQISQYARLNRKNAEAMLKAQLEKQQQLQQQQQTAMSDAQRKDFIAQRDIQRNDFKVQAQVIRADKANDTRAAAMQKKIQSDAENQRLKIQLENENKAAHEASKAEFTETESDIRQQLANMNGVSPSPNDFEPIV